MKKLLAIVVLGTILATPAFAQRDPNDTKVHQRARAAQVRYFEEGAYLSTLRAMELYTRQA
jgi:hypothetical protein